MSDEIPAGHITLRSAFDRYSAAWADSGSGDPLDDLRQAFGAGHLTALVTAPNEGGILAIPQEAWSEGVLPQRLFLGDTVQRSAKGLWRPYAGRSPMVIENAFEKWLKHHLPVEEPDPADFDVA